jgi:acyl-CoA oxidase
MQNTLTNPALTPYLPLLYVAWADGDLNPAELAAFKDAVHRHHRLDSASLAALDQWLDPATPPEAADLEALLEQVHQHKPDYLNGAGAALEPIAQALGTTFRTTLLELLGADFPAAVPPAARDSAAVGSAAVPSAAGVGRLLQSFLDGDTAAARNAMRAVLSRPAFRYRHDLPTAEYREQVLEWLHILAQEGFGTRGLPKELGGTGDLPGFLAAFETLGTHDQSLTVKFGVQFGLFAGSIQMLGTERHHHWLTAAATLQLPGCFAMSELAHGSNVRDVETEARYDASTETFVVHTPNEGARKEWIGNAACHGRMATVFAQLRSGDHCHGVHALLVPIRSEAGEPLPGVRIADAGTKMGLNGVDNGSIWFNRVRVPRENLLNRYGDVAPDGTYSSPIASPSARFFTMLGTLVGGRISVARFALSAARSGLAITVRYSRHRRQFGPAGAPEVPILQYQTHQRRLLPALASTVAAGLALDALNRRYLDSLHDPDRRAVEADAAALKAWVTWHVTSTLQHCRECCGGQGFLAANRVGVLKSDTDVYTTFEGDNTVLMQLVARSLLTDYRQQFGNLRLGGVLRYVAQRASRNLATLNPVIVRNTSEDHLRNPDEQERLFEYRRDRLLGSVARRLKRRLDEGIEPFEAFRECQDHLVALGRAHAEWLIATEARKAAARAPLPLQPVLRDLLDLHALTCLERDAGWFQAAGALEGNKAKAIRSLALDLASRLSPLAVDLVAGFGIPDEILGAPIAFSALPAAGGEGV